MHFCFGKCRVRKYQNLNFMNSFVIIIRSGAFPLEEIIDRFKGTNRDIKFTDDTIENLLWTKYGSSDALVVLSVLYPWADLKNVFHIDHIYPKSQFTERRLKKKRSCF